MEVGGEYNGVVLTSGAYCEVGDGSSLLINSGAVVDFYGNTPVPGTTYATMSAA